MRAKFLGRSVLEAIASPTLQDLWASLIRSALARGHVEVVCRCDDALAIREIQLTLSRTERGTLEVCSTTLKEQRRSDTSRLRYVQRRGLLTICAWCGRAKTDRGWIEAEEAIREEVHRATRATGASHGACPACTERLTDQIRRASDASEGVAEA